MALGMVLVLTACTTQKKKGDLSTMGKLWHNTTAHYNGYFNADEIIDESIAQLSEQHQDNYLKLLDVYEYTEVDNPQVVAEQLDEALKKVTIVINLHPYSQWSDDCYQLAGKALYIKQDYEGAEKAFRFLINEYPPENKADKVTTKGKKGKRSSSKRGSGNKNTASSAGLEGEKPLTTKQRKKARKQYNREVAKRKKQRQRDKKKGRNSKEEPEEVETTPPPTVTPEKTTPAGEEELPPVGMVRLTKDAATGGADDASKTSPLKHRPAFQEAQLWLARTYIERNNYNDARRILNQLEKSEATYNDIRREVAVAMAYLAIREKDYTVAALALDEAVDRENNNDKRARYAFIKAQLYQKTGNSAEAYAAYEQVVKFRPAYAMEFAARLNMAQNAYLSGKGSADDAIANLERLLKDEKNLAYQDQIYFAMAGIRLVQGNEAEGIALLEQSLGAGSSNQAQQTEAYYLLAELFYTQEDYLKAKTYYDSALGVMNPGDERYPATERLRDNLVDIANNLEIIALQDSLLMVAEMTPEEQAELAKQLYEAKGVASSEDKDGRGGSDKFNPAGTLRTNISGLPGSRPGPATSAIRTESNFFAYDDRAMKRGEREFDRRWGDRPLEDDWRRSSRSNAGFSENEEAEEIDLNLLTQDQIDKILADVPTDGGAKETARLEIKMAMFELGRLYRDRLQNNEKSVEILEELDTRFPGNLHELDSWYYLYLGHTDLNNVAKAKVYRDKILQKYPTSTFGQILNNPNYAQEFMDEERQLNRTYDEVYKLFEEGQYDQVITQAKTNAGRLVGKHELKPRYALLMAMSTGNKEGKEAYISELQKVIATYQGSPEETRAKEILRLLGGGGASLPGGTQETGGAFEINDNELHYVIIIFESDEIDLNANKITVSDYNRTYHSLDKLRISNVYLGQNNDVPVLVLRRFKDKNAAMGYFNGVQKNNDDFIDLDDTSYQMFPITQSNYREVLRNRSVDGYLEFFQQSY
jgi:tetratricopeptide (TPR) repeat protein